MDDTKSSPMNTDGKPQGDGKVTKQLMSSEGWLVIEF